MKRLERYKYHQVQRSDGRERTYDVKGMRLPSVTTILSRTKDQGFIRRWKAKVGEAQAEAIKNLSSQRGTSMHKYIEAFILQKGYEDMTSLGQQAKNMANKLIENSLLPIDEYYGSEVTLYYPGLYAGSTDLVCVHNDMDTIVDFKQANSPKRKEWVDDYYYQIAAYALAHQEQHGPIDQGLICICTKDGTYQEFKMDMQKLDEYENKWFERVERFEKLKKKG